MDTIFKNSKNSRKSDPHRLLLNLTDEINLKRSDKYVALSNLKIYYTWKNTKSLYKNNKFKISTLKVRKLKMKMKKMFLFQKLLKQYQHTVILLTKIISKIQESCMHLFLINHLVNYQIFHSMFYILKSFDSEFSYIEA